MLPSAATLLASVFPPPQAVTGDMAAVVACAGGWLRGLLGGPAAAALCLERDLRAVLAEQAFCLPSSPSSRAGPVAAAVTQRKRGSTAPPQCRYCCHPGGLSGVALGEALGAGPGVLGSVTCPANGRARVCEEPAPCLRHPGRVSPDGLQWRCAAGSSLLSPRPGQLRA